MKKEKPPIENKIYASLISICETMEHDGVYKGNGHHLAQTLTQQVSIALLPKEKRLIFDVLTTKPQCTRDIAKKVNRNTSDVSAQLKSIQDNTLLITSTLIGSSDRKRRQWSLKYPVNG